MEDPRFWFGMPQPVPFDFDKVDYRLPTRIEYLRERLPGFDVIAWDVIELYEAAPSKRAFKRSIRKYSRAWGAKPPITPS